MKNRQNFANRLLDFIYDSPSPFHVAANVKRLLTEKGFTELKLTEAWDLEKAGKYFVTTNESAVIAFVVGTGEPEKNGFKLIAAHTDSPAFKIKPSPEIKQNNYLKLNTEAYGGLILFTWIDRPLSFAGRVSLQSGNALKPETRFVNFEQPLLTIPNLAIHLNRDINDGFAPNKQINMLPVLSLLNKEINHNNLLMNILADKLSVDSSQILDFELYLYEHQKGTLSGLNNEFISSGKLDDLAMVHAGITALADSQATLATNVMVCFDNEEIGSATKQGAASPVLKNILRRIALKLGKTEEDFQRSVYNSFLISSDMAHAVHPNLPEKHDPITRPEINQGPVIKIHANQKYTTDSDSAAVFGMICKQAGIPFQKFVNRSDMASGGTLGSISSSQLDFRAVDIGNPMLAMHSIRELAGVHDHTYIRKAFDTFYAL